MVDSKYPPVYIGTCNRDRELRVVELMKKLDIDNYKFVKCERCDVGWVGAWKCHQKIAMEAINDGCDVYLSMEDSVTDTKHYSRENVIKCYQYLKNNPKLGQISLSRFYINYNMFNSSVQELSKPVYKNNFTSLECCHAILMTKETGQKIIDYGNVYLRPIDMWMVKNYMMKHICYPSCFKRSDCESIATPSYNHKYDPRRVANYQKVYNALEILNIYPFPIFISIIVLVVLSFTFIK